MVAVTDFFTNAALLLLLLLLVLLLPNFFPVVDACAGGRVCRVGFQPVNHEKVASQLVAADRGEGKDGFSNLSEIPDSDGDGVWRQPIELLLRQRQAASACQQSRNQRSEFGAGFQGSGLVDR